MAVRFATQDDIAALVKIRFDYFASENWALDEETESSIRAQLQKYYSEHLNRDFFAAVIDGETGGFASAAFLVVFEKPANPSFPTGKTGLILSVFTYPEYRKKGCATLALKTLIDVAKTQNLSYIELSASESGKSVYGKLGFQKHESAHFTEMRLTLV